MKILQLACFGSVVHFASPSLHAATFYGALEPIDSVQAAAAETQARTVKVRERLLIDEFKVGEGEAETVSWGVVVAGTFEAKGPLHLNSRKVPVDSKTGEFSQTVPYESGESPLIRLSVGGYEVTYKVRVLDPDEGSHASRLGIDVRAGWGMSSLSQTTRADSTQMGVFGRAAYTFRFAVPRLRAVADAYVTALPFSSSREETARYYGASARGSYHYPLELSPWSLQLGVGYLFNGMLVTDDTFGFDRMNALLVQAGATCALKSGAQISADLRIGGAFPEVVAIGELTASALYRSPASSGGFHWLAGADLTSIHLTSSGRELSTMFFTVTGGVGF